jgi:hypothetical protein
VYAVTFTFGVSPSCTTVEDEGVFVVGGESVASAFLSGPIKETIDRDIAKRRTGCFKGYSCVRRIR